jgi:hypothetical protein
MDNTRKDFNTRKEEIENYFKFLKIFDDDNTKLQYTQDGKKVIEKIESKFLTILLANAFLILYNLIEATVRNSIVELYHKIEEDNISFEKLNDNLKKLWIKQETDNLKERNFKHDTLREYIMNIAQSILRKETIRLSKDSIDLSGNIDAQKIRELAQQIGFDTINNGRNLVNIKEKRNKLAHGELTFYDVGKDYSVKELFDLKDETFKYLEDVIEKIERYIADKSYKME